MIWIAHRGNQAGANPSRENTWGYISKALDAGLHVEVDVRVEESYHLWLGHDGPTEEVAISQLMDSRVWCHAKTPETFAFLQRCPDVQTFFQEDDALSLTTNGYLWCHSKRLLPGPRTILTIIEGGELMHGYKTYGICTDFAGVGRPGEARPWWPRLVILDVDGVMTDGTKSTDREGATISKRFCDRDFTAIKRFKQAGVFVVLVSGDQWNKSMAAVRGLSLYNTNYIEKSQIVRDIMWDFHAGPENTVFVGDDYYDLAASAVVDVAFCPEDACADLRGRCELLPARGGEGVVAALYDRLRNYFPQVYPKDSAEVNP